MAGSGAEGIGCRREVGAWLAGDVNVPRTIEGDGSTGATAAAEIIEDLKRSSGRIQFSGDSSNPGEVGIPGGVHRNGPILLRGHGVGVKQRRTSAE